MKKLFKIGCNTIITREDKILLGKRKNCYGEGTWGFPGGHLEVDENLIDAAKRELREELGITRIEPVFCSVTEGSRDVGHYIQVNFLLKDYRGEIKLLEPDRCEEWRFFDPTQVVDIFPPHQRILNAYLQKIPYL